MNPTKSFRYLYYRIVRVHGKPREVAMGMAIGLAVGMTPTMGVQMIISIAIATIVGQNRISAALGCWITNPITATPIYFSTYAVGAFFLDMPLVPEEGFLLSLTSIRTLTAEIAVPLWLGGFITAIPMGAFGYWLSYQGIIAYRLKIRQRRQLRLHTWKWNPKLGWHRVRKDRHDELFHYGHKHDK